MNSNKPVQDKLPGLAMANDGTLPHAEDVAFTSHARLAKHVIDEVRHNAGDKSTGATAFPAAAILYDVLFNRSVDLRGRPILRTKSFADMLKSLKEQQEKVKRALKTVSGSLTGERLSVALEIMRALHVYESVGVQAAALIQQVTSEQFELTSLAFKRKMEQGKGAVSKLRAETVMSVVVAGTRGGCEKNTCDNDTTMFLEKVSVRRGPLSPNSATTQGQCKSQNQPAACITNRQVPCKPPHCSRIHLPNMGDTCYLNLNIQCLAHCRELNSGRQGPVQADTTTAGTSKISASERAAAHYWKVIGYLNVGQLNNGNLHNVFRELREV